MRKILSPAMFLACAFFIYLYIKGHLTEFSVISSISTLFVFLIACTDVAFLVVNGLFVKVITGGFGIDLRFSEYFSISVMTSFGNLFLPMKGGAGIKAVYLKTRHGFNYSYFLSGLGANYLVAFNISSLAALACLAIFYTGTGAFSFPVTLAFLVIAAMTLWAILLSPPEFSWIPIVSVRDRVGQVMSGWRMMRKDGKTVPRLYRLSALNLLVMFVITWLEFGAFHMKDVHGNGIGLLPATIFSSIAGLSLFISVTPSSLGIRETLLMFCSHFLGITPAQALMVSLLDRAINAVLVCLLFGFAWMRLNRRLKTAATPTSTAE